MTGLRGVLGQRIVYFVKLYPTTEPLDSGANTSAPASGRDPGDQSNCLRANSQNWAARHRGENLVG